MAGSHGRVCGSKGNTGGLSGKPVDTLIRQQLVGLRKYPRARTVHAFDERVYSPVSIPLSARGVPMKKTLRIFCLLLVAPVAQGADIDAGKAKVAAVCAA